MSSACIQLVVPLTHLTVAASSRFLPLGGEAPRGLLTGGPEPCTERQGETAEMRVTLVRATMTNLSVTHCSRSTCSLPVL